MTRNPFTSYTEQQKQLRAIMEEVRAEAGPIVVVWEPSPKPDKEILANSKNKEHPGMRAFFGPRTCKNPLCSAPVLRKARRGRQPSYCSPRCQHSANHQARWAKRLLERAISRGIVKKSGAWLIFGLDNLGTDVTSAAWYLQQNPDVAGDLMRKASRRI